MEDTLKSEEHEVIDEDSNVSQSLGMIQAPTPNNHHEIKNELLKKPSVNSGEELKSFAEDAFRQEAEFEIEPSRKSDCMSIDEKKSFAEISRKEKTKKSLLATSNTQSSGPRWKGKSFSLIAKDNPMSNIIKQLQNSFLKADIIGQLSGSNFILPVISDQSNLLDRACFGRPISTLDRETTWVQLGPEEAFYLVYHLTCLRIINPENGHAFDHGQLWKQINSSSKEKFPKMYAAYAHLRSKNWVVRPGIQYGVDFVAYRHHPALVHSEYAVLVVGDDGLRPRLKEWADLQGTLRVCGSVAKAVLVLTVKWGCSSSFPLCLEQCCIEERVMERWIPQRNRDGNSQD